MTNSADPDLDLHCLLRQGMLCSAREGLMFLFVFVCRNVDEYVLRIEFPKRDDAGFYNCTGQNRDSSNFVMIQLVIECKCKRLLHVRLQLNLTEQR